MSEALPDRQPASNGRSGDDVFRAYPDWAALNVARWTAGTREAPLPEAVLVVGQPGAGKGTITDFLCGYFASRGQCVVIDPGELLYTHPHYAELCREDLNAAGKVILPLARRLAADLLAAAIKMRRHLVLDGPSLVQGRIMGLVKQLKAAGYRVTVLALSVDAEQSWQSAQERDRRLLDVLGIARCPDREAHDAACGGVGQSIQELTQEGLADEFLVLTREGTVVEQSDEGDVEAAPEPAPAEEPILYEPPPVGEAGWRRRWQQELRRKADERRSGRGA